MKNIDLSYLVIDKLIIHEVPKHKVSEKDGGPIFSENESTITDGLRDFFQKKIKAALLSEQSFKVCFLNEFTSPASLCTQAIIRGDDLFVEQSKDIATYLYNKQKGNNAAGILLVLRGRIKTLSTCVIMKLERDSGAQLVLDETTKTFNVAEVKNLMLTTKTKVFKVALFISRTEAMTVYDGILMDYQNKPQDKKNINSFFLEFMGCMPFLDPRVATKNFYEFTKEYIETLPDLIDRSRYIQDLNSYLHKNQKTVSPREFANDYMNETQHKNGYKAYLESKEFAFETYAKDNIFVASHINKILIEFENGISILGAEGTFDNKVILTKDEETGECKAEIKSKIKKVR